MSTRNCVLLAAALLGARVAADALEVTLPPETAAYKPSPLPGYQLAQRNCMTCHSAQYAATQPPGSPRAYWEATVKKMKKPFGAQFDDADIAPIADYLVKTYGAERGAAPPPAATSPAAISREEAETLTRYVEVR
jgi:mono/diheme cytochrome c family protein